MIDDPGNGSRRRRDDREIDLLTDRRDRGKGSSPEDAAMVRIDGVQVALEIAGDQVLENAAADRAGLVGSADEGDGLRLQHRAEIVLHGGCARREKSGWIRVYRTDLTARRQRPCRCA